MNQYSINSQVQNGELNLRNLPFPDDSEVTVFIVPKMDLSKLSFKRIRKLLKPIKGNLSESVDMEREER